MLQVCGICVDLVEIFAYHVLVQEVESGKIYLVPICEIENAARPPQDETVPAEEQSNIISMRGWKEWQEEEKTGISFRKARIRRQVANPSCQVIRLRAQM